MSTTGVARPRTPVSDDHAAGRAGSLLDRLRGSALVEALSWPHGLAGHVLPFDPVLGARDATRITSVTRVTPTMATITFHTPREWVRPRPGQHVLLGVELDGRRQTRAFSLSSSARRADGRATVTVRINPEGVVSRHLVTAAEPGDLLWVQPPRGEFVLPHLDPDEPEPLLLVSGGSGITPVLAMLRTLADDMADGRPATEVTFLHYTHDRADVPYLRELEHLAGRHHWLDLLVVVTGDGEPHGDHGLDGRIDATHLRRAHGRSAHVRACGPAGLMERLEDLLDGHLSLDVEFFQPPSRGGDGGGTIAFTTSEVEVVDDGRPLLDQAEDAGLNPDFGCRMGICHTCVRPRVDGAVRDVTTEGPPDADCDVVRLCVSVADGDVSVEL